MFGSDIDDASANQLVFRIAQHRAEFRIDQRQGTGNVSLDDACRRLCHDVVKQRAAFMQFVFSLLSLGDVSVENSQAIVGRVGAYLQPQRAALLEQDLMLEVDRHLLLHGT